MKISKRRLPSDDPRYQRERWGVFVTVVRERCPGSRERERVTLTPCDERGRDYEPDPGTPAEEQTLYTSLAITHSEEELEAEFFHVISTNARWHGAWSQRLDALEKRPDHRTELEAATRLEIRPGALSRPQAREFFDRLSRDEAAVREELIYLGFTPRGELPPSNVVRAEKDLVQTRLILPRRSDWPASGSNLRIHRVPGGAVILSFEPDGDLVYDADDWRQIQRRMNRIDPERGGADPALAEDGSPGPKTEAAVRRFQERNGLKTDGVVGWRTWQAIFSQKHRRGKRGRRRAGAVTAPRTPFEDLRNG